MLQSFFCDAMLGRLSRRLRMLGFFTNYDKFIEDDALVRKCQKGKFMLVTRDVALAKNAGDYCRTVLLTRNDVDGQLTELFKKLKTKRPKAFKTSVCTACGGKISKVEKNSVKNIVYPRVYSRQKAFFRCEACGKLYWKGTHIWNLSKQLGITRTRGTKHRRAKIKNDSQSGKGPGPATTQDFEKKRQC